MTSVSMVKKLVVPVFLFVLLVAQAALAQPPDHPPTKEDLATAYEYIARENDTYDPDLPTDKKIAEVKMFFKKAVGKDYDENDRNDQLAIYGYVTRASEVRMVVDFDYKALAKWLARDLGISGGALTEVDRRIDAWTYKLYVKQNQPPSGDSDVAVIPIDFITFGAPTEVEFALYHELGHALWAFDTIRNAVITLVPGGDTSDQHKMEYFADIVAAKIMKAGARSKGEVLAATTMLITAEHPSVPGRLRNIIDKWEQL